MARHLGELPNGTSSQERVEMQFFENEDRCKQSKMYLNILIELFIVSLCL